MVDGCEVAGEEVGFLPMELVGELCVLPVQGGGRDGPAVGADTDGDFELAEFVDRMVGEIRVHVGLQVADGADLQQDVFFP